MAQRNLSKIVDDNGDEYLIKAKGLEDQVQIALTGDVTGTVTTDLTSDPSISTSIGTGKVTESKLATDSVTVNKIKDGEITKAKLNASAYNETDGTIADGTNSNLATKTQVKAYVESVVSSEGHYKGVMSVATINSWTAANLHNGDRVITSSDPEGSGTGTLTLGNLPVVDGQEVIFYVSDDQSVKIWQSSEGNYKIKQTAVSDPTASGTTITAIDTISQNANGEITPTKKTIRSASTSQTGVVQLAGSIGATVASENNKAASEKAVRDAINALDSNATSNDGTNVQVKVTETDGKISAVNITTDNTENKNNKVTSWSSTTTDTHYPSEKLVKDTLDANGKGVAYVTTSNTISEVLAAVSAGKLVVYRDPTDGDLPIIVHNSTGGEYAIFGSIVGNTAYYKQLGETGWLATSTYTLQVTADKVTSWSSTTTDSHYPSEKLVKTSLDAKLNSSAFTNENLGQGYGTCSTAESTAAKAVTLSNYVLKTGGVVAVKFTYGLCASATLNVNSKGAKNIFIDGAAVTATTAKRVLAGDIAYFIYDGTQYQFLGTDKAERKFDINYRASDNALVFTKKFGTAS